MSKRPQTPTTPTRPTAVFMAGGWGDAVDAAAYTDLSLSVVRRAIRSGRLTAYRIGGGRAVRLKREHADQFLQSQQIVTPFVPKKRARA